MANNEKDTAPKKANRKVPSNPILAELLDWAKNLAAAFLCALLCVRFVAAPFRVVGYSMYPTLEDGQTLIVWRLGYEPKQGDIITVRAEDFPSEGESEIIVKRVIAVGGQTVHIDYDSNTIYVDGAALEEDYLNFSNTYEEEYGDDCMAEKDRMIYNDLTLEEDEIFVMGDNRNGSTDSRDLSLGPVPAEQVIGKVIFHFG